MREEFFEPRDIHDHEPFDKYGDKVPLGGYLCIQPLKDQFLLRVIAQQPVMLSLVAGTKQFHAYEKVYFYLFSYVFS